MDFLHLGGEALAEIVANSVTHPAETMAKFPDLTNATLDLGLILDRIAAQQK